MVGFAATETFDFKFETMGKDGWASNYAEHTVEGTIANVVFASANKQANTITDVPVTKGGNVTATLKNINSYKITGVKFVCKQWGSKAQTITLNVSGDGEAFTATQTTSDNFTLEATGLDTKAVRFTFSSTSNQVGISSLEITYETVPQGGDQPAEVATPAITVASSFEEGANESLSISCATEGATIYYSIEKDGETLVELEEYDGAVDLSEYEAGEYTVEALAENGDATSDVAEATFTITEPAEAVEYKLVTSTDDLQGGDFVIFSSRHAAGLGASGDGINSGFTFNGNKVEVETEDILVLSIVPANTEGAFAIMHGEKYMNLANSASAPTFTSGENACLIAIGENGIATIQNVNATSRALIYRGGTNNNIFKNYALSNVGGDYELVQIFKKVELTLAEVLELEEPANVNLTTDLGVQKRIGTNAWAFDSNNNWIRLKFANEDAAEQAVDYANIHNLKGAYNGDYKDPEFTVTSFESSEESLEANIWEINLEQGFEEMPTPGQIVQVTGYYQSGGTLRGWPELKGTSLTLANDFTDVHEFAMDNMENVFVGALYRNVEVAIQYKGDMPANGAPRRISPAEVDYDFQNLVGQLTENSMPVPSENPTGVKTVEGAKEVKSVKYVNTVGQTSDRAFDGVNVMITTYTDGTTNTVKVVK